MSNGTPAPVPPPAPAATKFNLFAWLGDFNNLLTTFGAIVAAIAAILSTLNKIKLERIDSDLKKLDFRTKVEQSSRDYANIFIKEVLSEQRIKKDGPDDKRVQALLSILNIVAQASGSDEGKSNAKTRAMTPVVLALLLGEPGGVAQMDESYEYLDDWVAIACADDNRKTRITAIQALGGMCQKALRAGRLDIVVKSLRAGDQLLGLIPKSDDPKDRDYISVLAARSQLASFIKKEDKLVDLATDPDKTGALGDPAALRAEIRSALSDATAVVQETKAELEAKVASVEQTKPGQSQPTTEAKNTVTELKQRVAQLDAALTNASQAAVAQIARTPAPQASPGTATSPATSPAFPVVSGGTTVKALIKDLLDKDAQVRRRSRSQLGLLGQTALKPLLEEVAARFDKNTEEDYRLRLGTAHALSVMVQPITLDPTDAYWVVSLLRSNDRETRLQTSEFLMNLEKDDSILRCFIELEKLFYELCRSPKEGGNTVNNAAIIVGTWARNISSDTPSYSPGTSMPQLALQRAKFWQKVLTGSTASADWKSSITALGELIARAEAAQKGAVTTLVAPQ
jgi:hypothetical protein